MRRCRHPGTLILKVRLQDPCAYHILRLAHLPVSAAQDADRLQDSDRTECFFLNVLGNTQPRDASRPQYCDNCGAVLGDLLQIICAGFEGLPQLHSDQWSPGRCLRLSRPREHFCLLFRRLTARSSLFCQVSSCNAGQRLSKD